jgi:hypothetical protein
MKLIPLHGRLGEINDYAIIDDQDYKEVSKHRWFLSISGYSAVCCIKIGRPAIRRKGKSKTKTISMHRFLMNPLKNEMVEHLNLNRIDNRRGNLNVCSYSDFCKKTRKRKKIQGDFIGVVKQGRRWGSYIDYNGKELFLGCFATPLQAAFAYDNKAQSFFGKCANLNFSDKDY